MRHTRILASLLLAGVACSSASPTPTAGTFGCPVPEALVSVGQSVPDCTFEGVGDEADLALSSLEGTPLVINFWASWCVSCRREMPDFDEVHRDLGRQVAILGMNTLGLQGEARGAAETFAQGIGVSYPLLFDEDSLLYAHFGNRLRPIMPTTVFVDGDGIVRNIRFGEISAETLRELIAEHLGVA